MKSFLASLLGSAIGVVVLGLLVVGGAAFLDDATENSGRSSSRIENPPGLEAVELHQVRNVDSFAVRGTLVNVGSTTWNYPDVTLRIYAGEVQVNECDGLIPEKVLPGSRHPFQVTCEDTAADLPFPVRYRATISEATRTDG
jgi:hypothetical protein